MVGAQPDEIHFTSCGTEADAWWGGCTGGPGDQSLNSVIPSSFCLPPHHLSWSAVAPPAGAPGESLGQDCPAWGAPASSVR